MLTTVASLAFGQSSDPHELWLQARQLALEPAKGQDALNAAQSANRIWETRHSTDIEYAESLDLAALLYRAVSEEGDWAVATSPWLDRAVRILSEHPDVPPEVMALALELQSDVLGSAGAGSDLWARAARLRATQVANVTVKSDLPEEDAHPVYPIGRDVQRPALMTTSEPQYSWAARLAKRNGLVVFSVVIGSDGVPRRIQLVRGCGFGLDEKAAEAVSLWRFEPGVKAGVAIAVRANLEVNFRLLPEQETKTLEPQADDGTPRLSGPPRPGKRSVPPLPPKTPGK